MMIGASVLEGAALVVDSSASTVVDVETEVEVAVVSVVVTSAVIKLVVVINNVVVVEVDWLVVIESVDEVETDGDAGSSPISEVVVVESSALTSCSPLDEAKLFDSLDPPNCKKTPPAISSTANSAMAITTF